MKEKWRFRNWGIMAKTMAGYIALALIVTLFAGFLAYDLGHRNMREASLEELLRHARKIAAREQQEEERLQIPSSEELVVYQQLTDSLVYFVNTEYVAVRAPAPEVQDEDAERKNNIYTRVFNAMDQQFIGRVLMGETVTEANWFALADTEALFAGVPLINTEDEIVGGLILMQPTDQSEELWFSLRKVLLQACLIAMLVAVVLAWKMSETLTRPLMQITQAARSMGEGEYRTFVDVRSDNEIGELGRMLNILSARLSDTIGNLRGERDQLDTIIGSIGEGIIAVDGSGRVVRLNRAFLEMMEIEDMTEISRGAEGVQKTISDLLKASMRSRKSCRERWTSPSGRNILAEASPLFGKKREIIGSVALLQDVSESERLEQLRRDYIANISHELRTPLTGIRGMVEPLMDGYIDTEAEKADCYQVIYRETLRLEKLIGEMLDVSRLQAGRVKLETEALEVHGIVEEGLRRVRATAAEAGVELRVEMPDEELVCMGNEDRILQVLTIFLDNALSFTPTGGSVTAYARNEQGCVRLGVIDTGVGIEPKDLPFIWERFYKSDRSRMRTSGTGLGLAIAKLVVELMGGEIGVNTRCGKGSEFYFTLKKE